MHAATFSKLLVHVPLVFLASVASAQTGEVRTGAAALDGLEGRRPRRSPPYQAGRPAGAADGHGP